MGMPKKTLYVKDSDVPIWDRARAIAGDSGLSTLVIEALADYLPRRERQLGEVVLQGRLEGTAVEQQFRFIGSLVLSIPAHKKFGAMFVGVSPSIPPREQIGTTDVYVTKGHAIVIHEKVPAPKNYVTTFKKFADLEAHSYRRRFKKEQLETIASAAEHAKVVEID